MLIRPEYYIILRCRFLCDGVVVMQAVSQQTLHGRKQEVIGVFSLALFLLVVFALLSYDSRLVSNWVGALGICMAAGLYGGFGACAWLLAIELALLSYESWLINDERSQGAYLGRFSSVVVNLFVGSAWVSLAFPHVTVAGDHPAGGMIGTILSEVLVAGVGEAGGWVITWALLLTTFVLRSRKSLRSLARHLISAFSALMRVMREVWNEAKQLEGGELEAEKTDAQIVWHNVQDAEVQNNFIEASQPSETSIQLADVEKKERAPRIVQSVPIEKKAKPKTASAPLRSTSKKSFVCPPVELLEAPPPKVVHVEEKVLRNNAARLVEKLAAYGVNGRVDEIHPGPVVTMYEFEPQSGTKVAKIASLADDLAMALAAQKVRIVAPIPGKARVGFELPNAERQTVSMREIVEDSQWSHQDGALPLAFGQDIEGKPYYADLAQMPHVLVAGATGAGKSVGINVMLTSLLLKRTPEEVRFLMIDPKVVELALYDGIPHMLLPVVTDMKKAARALKWAVDEMERRYQLFADAGARNITSYNDRVERVLRGDMAIEKLMPSKANKVRAQGPDGEEIWLNPSEDEGADGIPPPTKLPYIVLVVDEFADLMMVSAKDVESAVARLAQKARAAGIHVILATQRPSVDVITGMIKANFPARVAFKVSQREDSKTILGRSGAEHLLGRGDMLIIPPGSSDLKRVHSAYISEDEVRSICDHLRTQGSPIYEMDILKPREDEDEIAEAGGDDDATTRDKFYDRAVSIVAEAGYCSISHLQRQLTIGYNRAAKLVEAMEKEGVVGPANPRAGGRREVLVASV